MIQAYSIAEEEMAFRGVFKRKSIVIGIFTLVLLANVFAATPVVKVDFNVSRSSG